MRHRNRILLAVAAVAAVAIAVLLATRDSGGSDGAADGAVYVVKEGPLTISVTESGTIQNREQVVLKNEVEGRVAILSLVPEGVQVKAGDLLVELDSSGLEDQRSAQLITVSNAEAAFIRARENLAVTKSQAESDVSQAALDLRFAKLDLDKYLQGDYPQALRQAEAEITIAREEVQRAAEKLDWSRKLHEMRYLSLMELQADELAHKKAQLDLELAQQKKQVLEEYSHQRDLQALESGVEQAERALERVRRKSNADIVQAEADLRAKESELKRQQEKLAKIEQQIGKTKIYAPIGGMVVHATTGEGGWRNEEPLEEGMEVRERQELIHLPTADSMMAEVKIHESNLDKVAVGMPVRLTVDAVPGKSYTGRVAKLAVMPDAQSRWMNPDLKVYNCEIHLQGNGGELRAGMSCRAEILVDRYDSAVQVPVQTIVRKAGQPLAYVVQRGAPPEARAVQLGKDNNVMVHILSGLEPGERVLMSPPLDQDAQPLAAPEHADEAEEEEEQAPAPPQPEVETPSGDGGIDWRSMTPEERRKRFESLSPEQRKELTERMGRRRNGSGDGAPAER